MEHKTWTTLDRATWGDGPWQDEPDKEQWPDEATGYACLIKRTPITGSLCGYVGVPQGHPWHSVGYGEIDDRVEVHGGLTYSDLCQEGPEGFTICHVPAPGEPEPLWWLGFDCAHAGDIMPAMEAQLREIGTPLPRPSSFADELGFRESYKTVAYVKAECAALAKQAADAALVTA